VNKEKLKNIFTKIGEVNPEYNLDKQVYNKGELLQFMDNPSERIQLAAVERDLRSIYYIQNQTEEVQLLVVKKFPLLIKYIQNPTQRVIQLARSEGFNI
jgi:hypothetical protein